MYLAAIGRYGFLSSLIALCVLAIAVTLTVLISGQISGQTAITNFLLFLETFFYSSASPLVWSASV